MYAGVGFLLKKKEWKYQLKKAKCEKYIWFLCKQYFDMQT